MGSVAIGSDIVGFFIDIVGWLLRSISTPRDAGHRENGQSTLPADDTAPSIFLSNRSRQKQLLLLEELFAKCELFPDERTLALVYVKDKQWAAVVAVSVVTGMNSMASASELNQSPHQWPAIQARCERHLKNRKENLQKKPKHEKKPVRYPGGRARIVPDQDPSGHVTDITD
jgi:hypothetical protein